MKISVIVAVYNGEKTISSTIDSFLKQTYLEKELIIIDGLSSDNTVGIISKYEDEISYWVSEKDDGIADAWNKALKKVTGEWILFLGSDDIFLNENTLESVAPILIESDSDIVYGQIMFDGGDHDGIAIGRGISMEELKMKMCIPHTATFQRKEFLDKIGPFDISFKIAIDYEIFLRAGNFSLTFIEVPLVIMGPGGVSSRLINQSLKEFRRAQLKHNVASQFKINYWYLVNISKNLIFSMIRDLNNRFRQYSIRN